MSPSPQNPAADNSGRSQQAPNSTPQSTASGQAPAAPDAAALRAKLKEAEAALARAQDNYKNLRSAFNQRDQEIAELKRQMESASNSGYYDAGDNPDTQTPAKSSYDPLFMEDYGATSFKVEHSDWGEYWNEMVEIRNDPARSGPYARYRPDGNLDWKQVWRAIYSDLKGAKREARLAELEAQAQNSTTATQQQQDQDRVRAAISGAGAHSGNEPVDIGSMTDEQLGQMLETDPSDPISSRRGNLRQE